MLNKRIPPFNPGELIATAEFRQKLNDLVDAIEREQNLQAIAPLELHIGPAGRALSLRQSSGFWAKYTGTGPNYDCTEQVRASGSWANGPRSYSAKCIEANGQTVPSGTIIWGSQDDAGDFVGKYLRTSGSLAVTVNVKGCSYPQGAGLSVRLTGPGGYDQTVTTVAPGVASFTVPSTGTYTAIGAAFGRFQSTSLMFNVTGVTSVDLNMNPTSSYACWAGCFGLPIPRNAFITLNSTPALKTSFTYNATYNGWMGCQMRTIGSAWTTVQGGPCTAPHVTPATVAEYYWLAAEGTALQTIYGICALGMSAFDNVITPCGISFNPRIPGTGWASVTRTMDSSSPLSCNPVHVQWLSNVWEMTET